MANTKWYFKHIIPIIAAILSVVTAVVLLQKDAMVTLRLCTAQDALCVILANIGIIATLTSGISLTLLIVVSLSDGLFLLFQSGHDRFKKFLRTPSFRSIKVSFVGNGTSEIVIKLQNREWRYPSVEVKAICGDNLKLISGQDANNLELRRFSQGKFAFLNIKGKALIIQSLHNQRRRLLADEHRLEVVVYITINRVRIARKFIVDIAYKNGKKITVTNITQLKDIPQEISVFELIEI